MHSTGAKARTEVFCTVADYGMLKYTHWHIRTHTHIHTCIFMYIQRVNKHNTYMNNNKHATSRRGKGRDKG